jgi:hypothetical protein
MGRVCKEMEHWRPVYIFSGQWHRWLKRGTIPLKTGTSGHPIIKSLRVVPNVGLSSKELVFVVLV